MVLINHARDLDLYDRSQTRRRWHVPARTSNQLPVNSAGNLHQQLSKDLERAGRVKRRQRFAFRCYANPDFSLGISVSRAPSLLRFAGALQKQKENQCQES
jgi:hypothetical protein